MCRATTNALEEEWLEKSAAFRNKVFIIIGSTSLLIHQNDNLLPRIQKCTGKYQSFELTGVFF